MTAFELIARLTADTSGFDKSMGKAEKTGNGFMKSMTDTFGKIKKVIAGSMAVAVIKKGVDAVIDLANEVSAAGDRIDKQSQQLGLSRKAFQEWDYILGQNGASIDSMAVSMKTLNNLLLDAQQGGEESKNAFAQLGVSIHDLENLSMEDQFEQIVRAFQRMPAGAQKSALAVKIFGRNGMELLPLLNQSASSIDELRDRAEELGLIMSDDAVDAAVVYGDSLDDLKRTFNSFKYAIGAKVLPVLTTGIQGLTKYAGKLRKAYDEKGLSGVFETLADSFRNIKWPTPEEILAKIQEIWQKVQDGAKNLLKLVFGESEDGGIAWPSPEEIETKVRQGLTDMWKGVQTLAEGILKLLFGETEDGGIAFPSPADLWEKIKTNLGTLWSGIQALASGVLKFVFGESEDGGIAWPSAEQTWAAIQSTVDTWWESLKGSIKNVLKIVLGVPELPDAHTAGAILAAKAKQWWEEIKASIRSAIDWLLSPPGLEDEDGQKTLAAIQTWWDEKVVPELKKVIDFVLGLFGLPPVDDMVNKINTWWNEVTATVGQLVLNATVNPVRQLFGNSPIEIEGSTIDASGNDSSGSGGSSHGFAKGLNFVPYDNFPALLHRGEQVLTASQARNSRGGYGGLDLAALSQNIVQSIREGMDGASVNSYMDGRNVSGGVNRRTMNQLKARRFAGA